MYKRKYCGKFLYFPVRFFFYYYFFILILHNVNNYVTLTMTTTTLSQLCRQCPICSVANSPHVWLGGLCSNSSLNHGLLKRNYFQTLCLMVKYPCSTVYIVCAPRYGLVATVVCWTPACFAVPWWMFCWFSLEGSDILYSMTCWVYSE